MNKRKILIVDDELGVRKSLKMIFKDNYEVLEADNGQEALRILRERQPDIILLDIIMPHVSGAGVLKEIKNIDKHLPVIVISAIKDTAMGKEAVKLGAFSYLTKPFDVMELELLVQRALKE
jgi:DNA-binding NtrC family response regulator